MGLSTIASVLRVSLASGGKDDDLIERGKLFVKLMD